MASIIDKIKSIFKKHEPQNNVAGGTYSGGYYSGYGSGAKYPGGMSRQAPVTIHNHYAIRQQSRDAMYDSMAGRALVANNADVIVDTGLKLKPTPIPEILGLTPEQAEEWAENIAQRFHLWAKSKKSHRSGVNNFYQNQHLYEFFQWRDNDMFIRFYYSKAKDVTNPLQIDFVDPNQLRGVGFTSTYAQYPDDTDGIIKDESGKEIAYKIWYFDGGKYNHKTIPARGKRSGRTMMIHGYRPEYAGQSRGMPLITHVLQELEDLTNFKMSVIQKAINQASYVFAVENDTQDPGNFLEGRVSGPMKQYGSFPEPAGDAVNVTDTEPIVNYSAMPEATNTVPGSVGVLNMRKGDKLKYLQDTSPSESYDKFVDSFFSYLAASTGNSIEIVLKKFNQNYSASRGALVLFWRVAQIWRDEIASDFLDPVYEMWLSEEIAAGKIKCPGWSDPNMKAAWLNCEWAGAPMPNIDPAKTAQADQQYVEMGAQTLDDVARNYNGSSGKANRAKLERQYSELPEHPFFKKSKSESDNESTTIVEDEE